MWINKNIKKQIETTYFVKNQTKRKTVFSSIFLFLKEKSKSNKNYFFINNKNINYFNNNKININKILLPFIISKLYKKFNFYIFAFIKGGGINQQIKTLETCLTRSLIKLLYSNYSSKELNTIKFIFPYLKDSRNKERRKFGLKKARKSPQYHKR